MQSSNDEVIFHRKGVRHPLREPRRPPQGEQAQKEAGFLRFLDRHRSPTHQRVTAGGRIVPMEPRTPPPQFKIDDPGSFMGRSGVSLKLSDNSLTARDSSSTVTATQFPSSEGAAKHDPRPARSSDAIHAAISIAGHTTSRRKPSLQPISVPASQPIQKLQVGTIVTDGKKYYLVHFDRLEELPYYLPAAEVRDSRGAGLLNSRSSTEMGSGFESRQLSDFHLAPSPFPLLQTEYVPAHNVYPSMHLGLGKTTIPDNSDAVPSVPRFSASAPTSQPLHPSVHDQLHQLSQRHHDIEQDIADLDKHTARHSHQMDESTKNVFIRRRIEYVNELGEIRKMKEDLQSANKRSDTHKQPHFATVGSNARRTQGQAPRRALNVQAPPFNPTTAQSASSVPPPLQASVSFASSSENGWAPLFEDDDDPNNPWSEKNKPKSATADHYRMWDQMLKDAYGPNYVALGYGLDSMLNSKGNSRTKAARSERKAASTVGASFAERAAKADISIAPKPYQPYVESALDSPVHEEGVQFFASPQTSPWAPTWCLEPYPQEQANEPVATASAPYDSWTSAATAE